MGRLIDADRIFDGKVLIVREEAYDAVHAVIEKINNAPTVDAEPVRHGRWQVNEMFGYKDMTCLSCGWLFEYYNGLEEEWNYCPHCGAKMDESDYCSRGERREDG